jgi:hypothetical protein
MSTKVQIPYVVSTIFTHCRDDYKNDIKRTCVCLRKTWNLTSLTMEAKEFQTTWCVHVWFPSWIQQSRCIHIKSMVWPHMHQEKPCIMGWRRLNLICNVKDKMLNGILKNEMIRWTKSQAPKLGLTQDFNRNQTWWQFENKSKMTLKNEWLCTLWNVFLIDDTLLSFIITQMVRWKVWVIGSGWP